MEDGITGIGVLGVVQTCKFAAITCSSSKPNNWSGRHTPGAQASYHLLNSYSRTRTAIDPQFVNVGASSPISPDSYKLPLGLPIWVLYTIDYSTVVPYTPIWPFRSAASVMPPSAGRSFGPLPSFSFEA